MTIPPDPVPGPSDRDANKKDVRKYRPVWEKIWPWLTFDGTKMYCKLFILIKKFSVLEG